MTSLHFSLHTRHHSTRHAVRAAAAARAAQMSCLSWMLLASHVRNVRLGLVGSCLGLVTACASKGDGSASHERVQVGLAWIGSREAYIRTDNHRDTVLQHIAFDPRPSTGLITAARYPLRARSLRSAPRALSVGHDTVFCTRDSETCTVAVATATQSIRNQSPLS